MKNGVILCTSVEQGAKIIEYFKSLGVDTCGFEGNIVWRYYGIVDGSFHFYPKSYVEEHNIPILKLPNEKTQELPEINFEGVEMEISDDGVKWYKAKVFGKINGRYITSSPMWNYARPIQQKVKVTKEQIAEAFNTTVDNLEIE